MIILKSREEIELMRIANQIVARTLKKLKDMVKEGITTAELDRAADEMVRAEGALPSFKGYRGFPCSLCTSLNEQVVHGIPGSRRLKGGDVVKLDLGANYKGYFGDAAISVPVGGVSDEARRLLAVTEESLYKGIDEIRPGGRLFSVSHAIQSHAEANGFSVVRDYVGHGIGSSPHEDPQVPNYGAHGTGPRLKAGMVLAIEPMVNAGAWEVNVLDDEWTVVTRDGRLSAHFEHSVAVGEDGPDILSRFE